MSLPRLLVRLLVLAVLPALASCVAGAIESSDGHEPTAVPGDTDVAPADAPSDPGVDPPQGDDGREPADAQGPGDANQVIGGDGVAPGDTTPPAVSGCTFPTGIPEEAFIDSADALDDTDPTVDAAVNAVMAALSGCSVGSSCDLDYPGTTNEEKCQRWFDAVNAALRAQGLCAGQHEVGTDEIAVSNTGCGGRWYGYHVCYYGGPKVVWNPGARRGWWAIDAGYCRQP